MKINKKQEKEVLQIYDKWLHSYLNGDVKTYDFYLDDDYRFIGSTDNEEFLNRKDTTQFLEKTADQLAGKTDIRNNVRTIDSLDGIVFITDLFDAYFLIGKDWTYYGRFRFTSALSKKKAGWRFIYQHFSMPDAKAQEGETLGAEQISKENQELRDAIKRRTVELEQKNRDLEIEAGLERVRSRAMAMQNSNELSELVDTLLQELTKLDFSLTACIINIIDGDDKSNTVWVTNPETGKNPESYFLKFEDYKFHHGMWKAWKARKNSWVYTIEGAEKETYQDYLFNETEFKRFSKKAKEEFMALEKWVASFTFSNFGGLQTIGEEPLSKSNLDILARFGKVFDLTYTRFNDLRLAEEQAREAQIELALERVRARTMAMQHSDELAEVATVLFQQVKELGIQQWTCGFNIWETGDKEFTFYPGGPDGEILPSCKVSLTEHPIFRQFDESRKRGDDLFVYEKKGEVQADHYRYMHSLPGIGDMLQGMLDKGLAFPSFQIDHLANFAYGNMIFITYEPFPEMYDVFKRFAKVFEQTYTRFLDLQKAEEQAKEAQIEAALERIRSRTLAMQKSNELTDVAIILFKQVSDLGIKTWTTGFNVWSEDNNYYEDYITSPKGGFIKPYMVDTSKSTVLKEVSTVRKRGDAFFEQFADGKALREMYMELITFGDEKKFDKMLEDGFEFPTSQVHHFVFGSKVSVMFVTYEPMPDAHDIFKRFGKVFDQTYTRFLDLQKAEAQAKEAQIETSLERVRAASMAMHHSADLQSVISIVLKQFEKLDIPVHAAFIYDQLEDTKAVHFWVAAKGETYLKQTHIPRIKHPFFEEFYKAIKNGTSFYTLNLTKAEKNQMFRHYFTKSSHLDVPLERQEFILSGPGLVNSTVLFDNTALTVQRYNKDVFTDEENEVIKRIGFVFEQAYTRFLDLEKAESQAKEAQVEAALERVRAASLAMHNSNELNNAVKILFKEFNSLGLSIDNTSLVLNPGESKDWIGWSATKTATYPNSHWPYVDLPVLNLVLKGWKLQKPISYSHSKAETHKFWKEYFRIFKNIPDQIKKALLESSGLELAGAYLKNTGVQIMRFNIEPFTEKEMETVGRFGHVFEQTYTRFLDLQKAEAQAKEAKIEAALEKVRSRTMAMQHSDELPQAANNLFLQVQGLGIPAWSAGYCIWEDNQKSAWCNMSSEGEIQKGFSLPAVGSGYNFYQPLKNNEDFYVAELGGKKLIKHYDFMKKLPIIGDILEEFDKKGIALPTFQIFHVVYFKHGYLLFITYEKVPDAWDIFKRFGKVFDQTYTRFLDLQKAEAQAREAQIETSLERVRSSTMAMHKSEDLLVSANLLYNEFKILGFTQYFTCGFVIVDEENSVQHVWVTDMTGEIFESFKLPLTGDPVFQHRYDEWKKKTPVFYQKVGGEKLKKHLAFAIPHFGSEEAEDMVANQFPDPTFFYMANFSHGYLHIVGDMKLTDKEEVLLARFTRVFEQTYTRFLDLQKAEEQTRTAQINLAVERVRAKALAMHKSEEIMEVVAKLKEEVMHLDIPDVVAATIFLNEGDDKVRMWDLSSLEKTDGVYQIPTDIIFKFKKSDPHLYMKRVWENQANYFVEIQDKKGFKRLLAFIREHDMHQVANEVEEFIKNTQLEKLYHATKKLNNGKLCIDLLNPPSAEMESILTKMGAAFDLAYKRFEDLQKAEGQAKEAQVEAALERVRSRSMAMHKSKELLKVIKVISDQLIHLNIRFDSVSFGQNNQKHDYHFWISLFGYPQPIEMKVPFIDHPVFNSLIEAYKNNVSFLTNTFSPKENKIWLQHVFDHGNLTFLPKTIKAKILNSNFTRSSAILKNTQLFATRYDSKPFADDENKIIARFAQVFEQSYTRFLDLQKAENQAREAEIELALERVRSRTMGMHGTNELAEIIGLINQEMFDLGLEQNLSTVIVDFDFDKPELGSSHWIAMANKAYANKFHIPFNKKFKGVDPTTKFFDEAKKGAEFYTFQVTKAKKNRYYKFLFGLKQFSIIPEKEKEAVLNYSNWIQSAALQKNSAILVQRYNSIPFSEDQNEIIKRFSVVLEQSYTRFLDLQKAETQAREAQIEAALERVRSKTMAMHNSQDVKDAVRTLFEEILKQNDDTSIRCGIGILSKSEEMELWTASFDKNNKVGIDYGSLNMNLHPLLIGLKKTWKAKKERFFYKLKGKELVSYFDALNNAKAYTFKTDIASLSNEVYHNSFIFSEGVLFAFTSKPIPEYTMQVLKRFTAVFEQTYTRFLDLQKAEAQVREAQIEAALETVRSRSLAMHKSDEVGEVANILLNKLQELEATIDNEAVIMIHSLDGSRNSDMWLASPELYDSALRFNAPYMGHVLDKSLWDAIESGVEYFTKRFTHKVKNIWFRWAFKHSDFKSLPEERKKVVLESKDYRYFVAIEKYTSILIPCHTGKSLTEDQIDILKRFVRVFEQAYIRFLDLQKAEAQAREAQIETSLERVRSKAMAMHNSKDLVITANQLFQEFQQLEISFIRCGVIKINEDKTAEIYSYSHTNNNKAVAVFGNFILTGHEFLEEVFKHWKLQKEVEYEMKGDAVKRYYKLINKQVSIPKLQLEKSHFGYGFYFPEGALYCITNKKLSEDTLRILRKFNTVMGLTYRRYFELQKAEARELAAVKESSLDRVRAEIASMQTADDLSRITPLVWKELNTLGVPFFRCGVFIIDQEIKKVHAYLSTPSGESLAALELEFDSMPLVIGAVSHWQKQKVYIEKWNKEQFIEFTQPLLEQGQINSSKKYQGGLEAPEQLVLQMVPFKQGMLYVGSEDSLTNNQIATVKSLAKAFSVAYTRYEDFKELEAAKSKAENTLTELKSTQTQLIQSEKMASLGELTAGIAHEIQNPLNFVNNFSELSEEMLEELEEEIKDNSDEIVIEIMTDLKQNLNKITNHGKRASNIVKGMLDHSRKGSGISELTDINKLADEYLRLSYHGLRAKDKTFNADFKTDFDTSLPKIKVVSQDLGRVILNLINNAFYACTERSRSTSERSLIISDKDYKPKVTVSTKKIGDTIEVSVKDNGSGIPEDIKDKIFQPFFTTKPTGSGTGLGLSLAYDIITKGHGGEMKVETKQGEETEFIIQIPIKK